MMETFRIDEGTATMTSETRTDGSSLEIDCRRSNGEDVRLRLEFTRDGMERFSEMVAKFVHSAHRKQSHADPPPAAEGTSAGTHDAEERHVERYSIVCMRASEVTRLLAAVPPDRGVGPGAEAERGDRRVVVWKVPDPRVQDPADPGFRVYLSPGALRTVRENGLELEVVGEISREELPKQRDLLLGNPPLDWQDTTSPVEM
jgi:hypothetical protein